MFFQLSSFSLTPANLISILNPWQQKQLQFRNLNRAALAASHRRCAVPHVYPCEHHVNRLKIFRKHRNKHRDARKIRGAIASAVWPPQIKKEAIEAGFYILEQSSDTMKLEMPKGFVPGEW